MSRWIPCLATLLLALTLAACGKATPPGGLASDQPAPALVEPSCPKLPRHPGDPSVPDPPRGAVPADFVTAWVLRCSTPGIQIGDAPMPVRADRADTPATELVAELRKPSEPQSSNPCTLELIIPPYILLVDANGRAVAPAIPSDGCGKPRREVLAELQKLPFRSLSDPPASPTPSPPASGCSDSWKDLFAIQAKDARRSAGLALPGPVTSLRMCVYDRISEGDLPVGSLATARTLEGEPATSLLAALDKAGPAADCSAPHTRFAVLTVPDRGAYAMVELDGCHRLLRADNTLGQLDPAAVELVSR